MKDSFDKFFDNHVQIIGVGDPKDTDEKKRFNQFKHGMKKDLKKGLTNN